MPGGTKYGRIMVAWIVMALGLTVPATVGFVQIPGSDSADPRVFPPSSTPFGKFYGEWGAEWWQWLSSIPVSVSPTQDETGERCAVGQRGPVWFLVGVESISGTATRQCTVPEGIALFFPVQNIFSTPDPPRLRDLRDLNRAFIDTVTDLLVEVNGVPIRNLERFRFTSPVFVLTLPQNNRFQAPPGPYFPTVDEGFYVMLRPLPVGAHTLRIHGENPANNFVLDVTYELTVVPLVLP
jgi:hypothetical protein